VHGRRPYTAPAKKQDNALGFADVDTHTSITGAPVSFASSNWVWGGGLQAGVTYFLDPS
jgi:hypothetical protein